MSQKQVEPRERHIILNQLPAVNKKSPLLPLPQGSGVRKLGKKTCANGKFYQVRRTWLGLRLEIL